MLTNSVIPPAGIRRNFCSSNSLASEEGGQEVMFFRERTRGRVAPRKAGKWPPDTKMYTRNVEDAARPTMGAELLTQAGPNVVGS
eukprot:10308545-Alexandrium_andersonii.AAC.1